MGLISRGGVVAARTVDATAGVENKLTCRVAVGGQIKGGV